MESLAALKHKLETWGEGALSPDLQLRVIDAVKPALSMSIVIALAFYLDFKRPYWAAFAVLMTSFSTSGQAFRRALVGIPGTIIGGIVALTLFSIFPQQPIFLIPILIIYCGICMYFMQVCKVNGYFFFTIAFVCLVVITTAIPNSDEVFAYALARLEETILGMAVYGIVTLLLWRRSAWPVLKNKVRVMTDLHADLFRAQMRRMKSGNKKKAFSLQRKAFRLLDKIEELVGFAVTDSYTVWEKRNEWYAFVHHSRELVRAQLRWGWVLPELRKEYMHSCLPDLAFNVRQLEVRLNTMAQKGDVSSFRKKAMAIQLGRNEEVFKGLSYFRQAQVVVVQDAFNEMAKLVHAITQYHNFFSGSSSETPRPCLSKRVWEFPLDYDYFMAALQSVFVVSLAAIIWFFLFPPGLNNAQFLQLGGAFAFIAVFVKAHAPLRDGASYVVAALIAIVLYVLTLQHLTTYYGLGGLIFCVTFVAYFIFVKESQVVFKLAFMLAWLSLPNYANVQSYDFTSVVNGGMVMALAGVLVSVGQYFMSYPLPERQFLRERKRFFTSAVFLLQKIPKAVSRKLTLYERIRLKACLQNLVRIPQTMLSLAERMDENRVAASCEQVGNVIFSFELLGESLLALHKTYMKERDVEIVPEFSALLAEWRHSKIAIFEEMEQRIGLPHVATEDVQKRIHRRLQKIQRTIELYSAQAEIDGQAFSPQENEILYQLLERNRGISNAMVEYFTEAKAIDWNKWAQARF